MGGLSGYCSTAKELARVRQLDCLRLLALAEGWDIVATFLAARGDSESSLSELFSVEPELAIQIGLTVVESYCLVQ